MILRVAVAIALAVLVALVVVSAVSTRRFRKRYERERAALVARALAAPARPSASADGLPAPVLRYLEISDANQRPMPRAARLRQRGDLATAPGAAWMPFESEQVYAFEPPGFLWLARTRVASVVHMTARDAFVDGEGHMLVRLLGWLTVADARGPEIDQGAALRYWGELLSFPEAVLDPRLSWEPIDDRSARVHASGPGPRVTAVVEFTADGWPAAVHAERHRDVGGKGVLTPWSGRMRDWRRYGTRMFPSRWESVWHLPEGDFVAVRMEILSVESD